ncbi:MAG: adenosine deaminase [Candidatus Thorarchaeota archaeon]
MSPSNMIAALPKVELHIHVVGSIRPRTLIDFIQEGEFETPYKSASDIDQLFQFQSFSHFISVYSEVVECITREHQFERLTFEMLEDLATSSVHYAEISFSAPDHMRRGLEFNKMLDAIGKGIRRAGREYKINADIRIDLVRNYGPESAMEVLDCIRERADEITSVDIGGSEYEFPPKPFAVVYEEARNLGLHLVAHAGEAAGPESVWDAIRYLKVERIGHGTSAIQDSHLMDRMKELGIAIEACPVSNVKTGVVRSLSEHPVGDFYRRGLLVSVNSDDPAFFDTDITNEYQQLHDVLGFSVGDLMNLTMNAVNSSFLGERRKERLLETVRKENQRALDNFNG